MPEVEEEPPGNIKDFIESGKYLAFVYNVRRKYPDPQKPSTFLQTDFDDLETITYFIKNLENCGFKVLPIEADNKAKSELKKYKKQIGLVFNYSSVIWNNGGFHQITSVLEKLKIPFTGSKSHTQYIAFDKGKTKSILLKNKISTLPYQIFKNTKGKLKKQFTFPLIVKPIGEGSSAGITNKSVVFNKRQLKRQIKIITIDMKQRALVEPFLTGREFSVSMLGNPPKILPIIESDHSTLPKNFRPIDSLEVKWYYEEQHNGDHLICPAKIDKKLKGKILRMCKKLWHILDVKDFCRIDIRCDDKGNPYILEFNTPAGMIPSELSTTSGFPLSCRAAGIEYKEMLKKIISSALKRYSAERLGY